jgi:hypothetical protein
MKNLHPAILPILTLVLAIGVIGGGVATYRTYGQKKATTTQSASDLNPKYQAPQWKYRQVWKDGKYVEEKYRDPTEFDRQQEMIRYEMQLKGRL